MEVDGANDVEPARKKADARRQLPLVRAIARCTFRRSSCWLTCQKRSGKCGKRSLQRKGVCAPRRSSRRSGKVCDGQKTACPAIARLVHG